jgi:hypothetical protein
MVMLIYVLFCEQWIYKVFREHLNFNDQLFGKSCFMSTILFQGFRVCCWWSMCYFVSVKSKRCFVNIISFQGFRVWCWWSMHCFVNTRFTRCFMNIPNLVLYLTLVFFTSTSKFVSRMKSLVLVTCVLFREH